MGSAPFERAFRLETAAETLIGEILAPSPDAEISTLLLHGAGQSSRQRQRALRNTLAQQGCGSAGFDFSGHGESSARTPNSLKKRWDEARQALSLLRPSQRTVVGTSMSGEIAMRLACDPALQISHLVTIVGAVYDHAAFELPFGPHFSAALRRPESWHNAATLDMIAGYRGGITLIRAANDAVIPAEIANLIAQRALAARFCRIMDLPDTDHRVSEKTQSDSALRLLIARAIMAEA
ncbi:alpha/beta fold hydrolase [Herbaspirillum lusitanum]|uniref:Alpha/beta fold hydrolase n=1 Tax=Herbaspirillum lusitanum TaxID=213312 RepID=A0ABW9A2T1_9BURK